MTVVRIGAPLAACVMLFCGVPAYAQQASMSFFVTSAGPGKGADLGGLAGADRHCQQLASAVGAGAKTWHAYLSTQGAGAVNARDRIGKGPWVNAKGVTIAKDVAELHGTNNLTKQTALSEKGDVNQRARRHTEQARHTHRFASGWHSFSRKVRTARARIGRAVHRGLQWSAMRTAPD